MNIGDVVTDVNNKVWLVYDMSDDQKYLYVTDLATQKSNEYIQTSHIINIESKPKNVSVMFLVKRQRYLKGLEKYL